MPERVLKNIRKILLKITIFRKTFRFSENSKILLFFKKIKECLRRFRKNLDFIQIHSVHLYGAGGGGSPTRLANLSKFGMKNK